MGAYDDLFDDEPAPAASGPAPAARPYADLFEDNPRPNMLVGVQANPDEQAERQRLAKRYNIPPEIADETFKARAKLDDANAAMERAPALRSWIAADGARAKVAHDDVENLSAIEQAMSIARRYSGAAVEGLVGQTAGGTLSGLGELYGIAARGLTEGVAAVTPAAVGDFLRTPIPEWLNPASLVTTMPGRALKDIGRAAGPAPDERTFGTDVTAGIGQMAGQIAAAILTGGTASTAMLFAQGADQMAEKTAQDEATQAEKDVATVLGAAWTGITEKYGLDKLLNRVPPALKNAALRKIADVAAGAGIEAAQEVAEGLGQDIIRKLATNAQAEIGQGVLDEASVAGTVGGIVRAALGVRARGGRAEQATREAEALTEVSKLAEVSKVRERSPDDFASFMQTLAAEGQVPPDVFIDARELDESTLRKLVEASPAAARQAAESLASGTDMQIPVAEFGTSVAGQPFAAAVVPHLKTDPNGMSKAQAEAADADQDRAAMVDAIGRADQQDAFERSRGALEARFLEQLNATGRLTPEVNRPQAALLAARYAALGSRLGITPEQAFEQLPVTIGTDVTAGALEQPAYHGSPHRGIEQFTTQKIGTGEGAQAYGWGMYFAGNREVAEFYRRTLTAKSGPANDVANHYLKQAGGDRVKALAAYDAFAADAGLSASDTADIREILSSEAGQLYEVEVPDDADMLDYDASLKDQPEKVRKGLAAAGVRVDVVDIVDRSGSTIQTVDTLEDARREIKARNLDAKPVARPRPFKGKWAYEQLSKKLGGPEAASRALFAAGIPGLRYLDASSRGPQVDKQSRNYVIFDDSAVRKTGTFYQTIDQTETPEFKRWFGDSKVVDANGKPLVVYHGSRARFTEFSKDKIGKQTDAGYLGAGFYFGDRTHAGMYAGMTSEAARDQAEDREWQGDAFVPVGGRSALYPVFLSLKNPLVLQETKDPVSPRRTLDREKHVRDVLKLPRTASAADVTTAAEAAGYDGVIFQYERGDPNSPWPLDREYVAFRPEQIKSAIGNRGTFDPNDPSILAQAGARGQYSPDTKTIALLKDANLSTFIHESGHLFLDQMGTLAVRDDAPASIREDMQTILDWFGVQGGPAAWNAMTVDQQREYHERFARGFEAYALEGKAPSSALAGAFQRFRGWLRRLYRSIRSLDVELTDEVRAVMDRMVATDEEIQQARAAQSMGLMFSEADAKKLGIDYRAYQAIDEEHADDAATELDQRRLRDLKWFDNAKSAALRALQRQARDLRVAVEAEVTAEVDATPTERARRALDEMSAADPETVERLKEWNERRDAEAERARAKVKAEILGQNPDLTGLERAQLINANKAEINSAVERDLRAWDRANPKPRPAGLTPADLDAVADQVGFASGEEMLRALAESPRRSDLITAMTDQRMLEQYGDITSREELEQAAIEAVYSKARARVVATELGALEKAAAVTTRTVTKAAQAFAVQVVGRQQVGKLRPEKFEAAARKAAAASLKAFRAGDIAKAAAEKRNELVNTYAAREARERKAEIDKKVAQYRRSSNKPIKEVAKTRDADLVQAMRAILAEYGIGAKGEAAQKYLDELKAHDPATHAQLADSIAALTANAKDYRETTVDEFRALADDVDVMWALSRRNRQMVIDGDLIEVQEAAAALNDQIVKQGVPARIPGEGYAVTEGEKVTALLRSARAGLRRVESWVNARDGGPQGPFRRYVWNPIKDAADRYRADQVKYLKRYRFLLSQVDLGKARIDAPELGYVFGYSKGGSGKQEILHAILHTGNASNKRKLLLGRGWGTLAADGTLDTSRWDAFIKRMIDTGVITKADYDFAQGVWDMLEDTKAGAQKTHREVFGRSFDEVTAEAFTTPFGEYRGGYVPAMVDADAVSDAKTREIVEQENQSMMHAFPSTPKGFTKGRVEYNRALALDLRTLSSHIDKVLMFTHLEQPVREVRRVLGDDSVRLPLSRVDSAAYDGMLIPWLSRAARQQVETPVPGYNGLFKYFTKLRSRAGMAAMFANVVNVAQQITGFSLAALRVRPRHLSRALVQYVTNPRQTAERVAEASTYMASRMDNEVSLMNQAIDEILLNPSVYQRAQAWTARHAYFLQAAVDNVMGPIIWTGAYNEAIEQGASEADARRQADSAVRETQGSNLPEDVANFEAGTPFVRLFTQFQGYFNMQANLLGTEFAKTQREMGLRAGMGRGLYIFTLGFLAPALVSQLIVEAGRGGPDDEDGDGYLDDWLAALGLGVARSAWALIPVAGPIANVAINSWNNKPYDDKISTAPAISMIEGAAHAPVSVYSAVAGEGSARKAVKDVASLISITTGLPAYAIARPAGYAADVLQGRVAPTGPADAVRGAVTGTPSPASKQ